MMGRVACSEKVWECGGCEFTGAWRGASRERTAITLWTVGKIRSLALATSSAH